MRVVVDTNVLVAALIRPEGWTSAELARREVRFFVPQFVLEELASHGDELLEKAQCSVSEWRRRQKRTLAYLPVIPASRALRFRNHRLVLAAREVDPRDEPVVASFFAARADYLWTFDRALARALPGIAVSAIPREGDQPPS